MIIMQPPQSIYIDRLTYNNLNFLTETTAGTMTSGDFNLTTGKPLTNIANNAMVDQFFLNIVSNSLKEGINVTKDYIYKYPQAMEVDTLRDIQVTDETEINAVFVYEGASMKNMFGYYTYTLDENGNKRILDNENATQDYYYRPTVVFPHVYSAGGDANTLQRGHSRRLRGNLPNGNFANIYVGFFLICHGWYAFEVNSTVPDRYILSSTPEFAHKYKDTEYDILNNKLYSVFAKSESVNGDKLLMVAFEDIVVDNIYDMDYNDCVVGLHISDVSHIVDYDKYAELVLEEASEQETCNSIVNIDETGEFLDIKNYDLQNGRTYIFERKHIFGNLTDRDSFYDAVVGMLANYIESITKVTEDGYYKVVVRRRFRPNDVTLLKNKNKKFYLFEAKFNRNNRNTMLGYQKELMKNITKFNYSERYRLYDLDTSVEVIGESTDFGKPCRTNNVNFRIVGNGLMDCTSGRAHLPFKTTQDYIVYRNVNYDNTGLTINVRMDVHPTGYQSGNKTFVRYVSFITDDNQHLVVDLGNLDLYQINNSDTMILNNDHEQLNTILSKIEVSAVYTGSDVGTTVKELISIFKPNSGATFRTVTINGSLVFYCVRFANIKNNPTMVFSNTENMLRWSDNYNTTSGTYFDKQNAYRTSSLIGTTTTSVKKLTPGRPDL